VIISEPGVYEMSADTYHADPVPDGSLSSSGARRLLPPGCPALYRYEQDHRRRPTKDMNFGSAAHKVVLGAGSALVDIDAGNYRTAAAQATRDEALAAGKIPLLPRERDVVDEMAAALREHPAARALFGGRGGKAEQALFWVDQPTGIWRRALVDWLPARRPGRMVLPDYKTCAKADPDSISKAVYEHGYHQQAVWYGDGVKALGLAGEVVLVLVFQEKTPPYLVTVVELDVVALKIGAALNRQAIELYRQCRESGQWPGYADDVVRIPLPAWAENRHMEDITS
jgi:hypothetical protein